MNVFRSVLSRRPSLPTAIALLALAVAGTGTAAAATGQLVNIADPTVSSRVAHVDNLGQLLTATPATTISSSDLLISTNGDNFITSSTKATLAITKLDFSNPSINSGTTSEVRYYLYKEDVDNSGNCVPSGGAYLLAVYNVAPGDDVTNTFPTPLVVAPTTPTTRYCISLYAQTLSGTYGGSYYPAYSFGAYRVSGTYTGLGASTAAAPATMPTPGTDR